MNLPSLNNGRLLTALWNTGGRFPSDLQVQRARGESLGQSSVSSGPDTDNAAMAGALPGSSQLAYAQYGEDPYRLEGVTAGTMTVSSYDWDSRPEGSYFDRTPLPDLRKEKPTEGHQQQPFSAREPADQSDPSAEHSSLYGEWMAPAATGVVGAAIGAAALEAYKGNEQDIEAPQGNKEVPAIPDESERRSSPSDVENVAVVETIEPAFRPKIDESVPNQTDISAVAAKPTQIDELGGLESEGARETGELFPKIIRHDTSQLHVPGEFPEQVSG